MNRVQLALAQWETLRDAERQREAARQADAAWCESGIGYTPDEGDNDGDGDLLDCLMAHTDADLDRVIARSNRMVAIGL